MFVVIEDQDSTCSQTKFQNSGIAICHIILISPILVICAENNINKIYKNVLPFRQICCREDEKIENNKLVTI